MNYSTTQIASDEKIEYVIIEISLSGRDWFAVENSKQWEALQNFIDNLSGVKE